MFYNKFRGDLIKLDSTFIRNLIVIIAFMSVYYISIYFFEWPLYVICFVYLGILAILALIFRASVFAALGNLFCTRGNLDKAKKMFNLAFKHKSKNPVAYLNYAIMMIHEGNGSEGIEYAQKALSLKPSIMTEKNAYLTIGSGYWVLDQIDKAIETLEGMIDKYDYVNSNVLTTIGYLYLITGKLEQAKKANEAAIKDNPNSATAWDNIGQVHMLEKNRDEAEKAFLKAISIRDGLADSLYFLGLIYEEKGQPDKAEEYFFRAYRSNINKFNTVTFQQAEEKYNYYLQRLKSEPIDDAE